jgi:hypothetical protein
MAKDQIQDKRPGGMKRGPWRPTRGEPWGSYLGKVLSYRSILGNLLLTSTLRSMTQVDPGVNLGMPACPALHLVMFNYCVVSMFYLPFLSTSTCLTC